MIFNIVYNIFKQTFHTSKKSDSYKRKSQFMKCIDLRRSP
ncbi:hypothetical protein C4J98_1703 [Pseudomonas orientalis]|nr:hypothetical protein C4J98_1703 [Pseudomonas orientalis]